MSLVFNKPDEGWISVMVTFYLRVAVLEILCKRKCASAPWKARIAEVPRPLLRIPAPAALVHP